jgi:hypothetical protein
MSWAQNISEALGYLSTLAGTVSANKITIDPTGLATSAKQPTLDSAGQSPVSAGYLTKSIVRIFAGIGATSQYDAVGALVEVPNWASAVGRGATLRKMRITCANNAIAPQFEVHFFKASDVTVAADNASWTELDADTLKRAGYIIMPTLAKAAGSGTIDFVRCQHDDYGQALNFQVTCDPAQTSLWMKLKLLNSGITFANSPGDAIKVIMEIEQS